MSDVSFSQIKERLNLDSPKESDHLELWRGQWRNMRAHAIYQTNVKDGKLDYEQAYSDKKENDAPIGLTEEKMSDLILEAKYVPKGLKNPVTKAKKMVDDDSETDVKIKKYRVKKKSNPYAPTQARWVEDYHPTSYASLETVDEILANLEEVEGDSKYTIHPEGTTGSYALELDEEKLNDYVIET